MSRSYGSRQRAVDLEARQDLRSPILLRCIAGREARELRVNRLEDAGRHLAQSQKGDEVAQAAALELHIDYVDQEILVEADVFAVAVMIAYLAAQASQSVGGNATVVQFDASFGSGFYWFAGYCVTSLAVQQLSARWLMKSLTPRTV
jgi:hypothetical protein